MSRSTSSHDSAAFTPDLEPGQYVRHPQQPAWGLGQVQSSIGARVTVNFEHAGKVLVNAAVISLDIVDPDHESSAGWPAESRPAPR